MKRSVNLNRGRRSARLSAGNVLDLMRWVGMSDADIRAAIERQQEDDEDRAIEDSRALAADTALWLDK